MKMPPLPVAVAGLFAVTQLWTAMLLAFPCQVVMNACLFDADAEAVSGKGFTNMKGEPALTDTDGLTKQAAAMIPLSVGV